MMHSSCSARWVCLAFLGCAVAVTACQRNEKRAENPAPTQRADTTGLASPVPEAEPQAPQSPPVLVESPPRGALITSPVRVTGKARGSWYFEAEFPIRVLDAQGDMIGTGVARAEGDWQTSSYVPFEASIVFRASPTDSTGFLVIEKSNPSGRFQDAAESRVPVRFR
jgi:immunoglobulin-like protein involved in spore germination